MAILKEDVKLMASERLTDNDDGGGWMSANEVVDGNVNNLFPDISRLDRVYGKVSMRKAFLAVLTDNTDTYYGAHLILTDPAGDPLVSTCMFTTNSFSDERDAARDRIESYVTQGARFNGTLWGTQLEGARAISMFQTVGASAPGVGDVLVLVSGDGNNQQYCRITEVTIEKRIFEVPTATSTVTVTRQIVIAGIADALRYTFTGSEIGIASAGAASVFDTVVADAAAYFGVMRLTDPITSGDLVFAVDSIYANLVPSAQAESPVADMPPGSLGALVASGPEMTRSISGVSIQTNIDCYLGSGVMPGSLTFTYSSHSFYESGGIIYRDVATPEEVGTIDFGEGVISFGDGASAIGAVGATISATYIPAVQEIRLANSSAMAIEVNNRGYNYVASCNPLPAPGSLVVAYMAQGKWYELKDNGAGVLTGAAGTGTGSINYTTGTAVITCGALPDAGSAIMLGWGAPLEYTNQAGSLSITPPEIQHTVAEESINPNSLTVAWLAGGVTVTAIDDGAGGLTGAATGLVNYASGDITIRPTMVPDAGTDFTYDYEKYSRQQHAETYDSGSLHSFTLPSFPIEPSSLSILAEHVGLGNTTLVKITDDGQGNLVASPFSLPTPLGNAANDGSTDIVPLEAGGTIDYATGDCVLYGVAGGTVKWVIEEYTTTTI